MKIEKLTGQETRIGDESQQKTQNPRYHDNFEENKSTGDYQIQVTSMTCILPSILLHLLDPPVSLFATPRQSVADQKLPRMMMMILCDSVESSASQCSKSSKNSPYSTPIPTLSLIASPQQKWVFAVSIHGGEIQ